MLVRRFVTTARLVRPPARSISPRKATQRASSRKSFTRTAAYQERVNLPKDYKYDNPLTAEQRKELKIIDNVSFYALPEARRLEIVAEYAKRRTERLAGDNSEEAEEQRLEQAIRVANDKITAWNGLSVEQRKKLREEYGWKLPAKERTLKSK